MMIDNYPIEYPKQFIGKNHYYEHEKRDLITEICPSIYYGNSNCLKQEIMKNYNFKIIINCLPTYKFLNMLNESNINISTDMIILSVDLNFDLNKFNADEKELLNEFNLKFNKVLQNFLSYFITYNPDHSNLINKLPEDIQLQMSNPILTGNLKNNLFKLVRLITLFKIINESIDVLVIGEFNENLSKSLIIGYLMDNYNYNLNASLNFLNYRINMNLNLTYYNDLLLVENLKDFYEENNQIKSGSRVLYNNKSGKRSRDDDGMDSKRIRTG